MFAFFGMTASASHIVGGEMYYDCLGGNQYKITLKLYRDCLSDGAEFDNPLYITVFDGNNIQIDNFDIGFPVVQIWTLALTITPASLFQVIFALKRLFTLRLLP